LRARSDGHTAKAIYLQKIRFLDDGRIEYRFAYYVIPRKGAKDRWIFANRPLFVPPDILNSMLIEAREEHWEGF